MRRAVRAGWIRVVLWLVAALTGAYLVGAGIVLTMVATPATDIDGPVSTRSRVFWGAVSVAIGLGGLTLLVYSISRIVRVARGLRAPT